MVNHYNLIVNLNKNESLRRRRYMILEYAEKVLQGGEITKAEAIELIKVSDEDTMLLLAIDRKSVV